MRCVTRQCAVWCARVAAVSVGGALGACLCAGNLFVAPAAIIFTLVGTGLGALFVEERWAAPESVRVGMIPGADGRVALAYHVLF
jgi:hypothetical protein